MPYFVPQVKPLYKDLLDAGITDYLKTSDFDRNLLMDKSHKVWENALNSWIKETQPFYDVSSIDNNIQNTLRIFLNYIYLQLRGDSGDKILSSFLSGFIKWGNIYEFESNILADIEIIAYDKRNYFYIELEFLSSSLNKPENETKVTKVSSGNEIKVERNEELKASLIKNLSKSEIEKVISQLSSIAKSNSDNEFLKSIVNISSRYSRIKKYIQRGIMDDAKSEIQINKINDALLDLILSL